MNNFHPLEVVGRDSGTQLQVVDNLNEITLINTIYKYLAAKLTDLNNFSSKFPFHNLAVQG